MCNTQYEDTYCVECGREVQVPTDYKYDPLCRKCVKTERAERKKFSKFFLKREIGEV